jgi:uncharacterized protein YeaO (DUF488 family)
MPEPRSLLGSEEKRELHPEKLKRFMLHLSAAVRKAEERSEKKQLVKQQLEKMKNISLNKRSTKETIETEFGSFESVVHELIHDDEKLLEEQKKETAQITELRKMVETLSRKMIDIGREYAKELEEKDNKIMELRESLAAAHIKISESGEDRQKKIDDIERRIKEKAKDSTSRAESLPERETKAVLSELETQLVSLESRHKSLTESGRHKKSDLERVKKLIDSHKDAIRKMKSRKK